MPVKTIRPAPEAKQEQLPGTEPPAQEAPLSVQGNKILAKYVRPHYSRHDGEYQLGMEFSYPLGPEHNDLIPATVRRMWKVIRDVGNRRTVDIPVAPHSVHIHFAPDDKPYLSLLFADIQNATLAMVEETGSGASRDVIRYTFRVVVFSDGPAASEIREFADCHFDKSVWIEMTECQRTIPE